MMRLNVERRMIWLFAPLSVVLFVVAACGSSDTSEGSTDGNDTGPVQTEVAAAMETQTALQKQVDDSVAATVAAQATATTPGSEGSDNDAEGTPEATEAPDPTATPSPTATPKPDPTATPEPPAPTATPVPPAPTATPEPPQPTPTPTEAPPTPTQPLDDVLVFSQPSNGYLSASGRNGSFAQASGSFDVLNFPARAYVRSGVYFGLGEDVTAAGIVTASFSVSGPDTVRVAVDVGWNGELRTNGWGSMTSSFEVRLVIVDEDGQEISVPVVAGESSIDSSLASKPVSGNRRLTVEASVDAGQSYGIWMIAECRSTGSSNVWASDSECIFDQYDGVNGFVEWENLILD